jgi:glycosyltransferase involved in cell wall biosynthesis
MKKTRVSSGFKLCLMCYPYYPSKDSGKGLDRYIFELQKNIEAVRPDTNLRLLHQGFAKGILTAASKLCKVVAELLFTKADVYHAISPIGGTIAAFLGKSPLVVTIHDVIPYHVSGYDYSWKYRYWRYWIQTSVKRSDAVVVPYLVTKEELLSRFNVPESKIHVVNYGVDHRVYYSRPAIKRAARQVLYIGEVSRSKGADTVLRAFSIVKKQVGDAELLIGGKKSRDQPMLENLAAELGLKDATFLGYIPEDDLPRYYSSATVMIFPSRCGFGLSTLEAMACGTPVIVGAVLDAPEFLADAGLLVNPDDPKDLAQGIEKILTDPELRDELSAKAIERAKAFSWEKMAGETAYVYDGLMQTKAER